MTRPPIRQLTQPCCGDGRHRQPARSIGRVRLTLSPGRTTMLVNRWPLAWRGVGQAFAGNLAIAWYIYRESFWDSHIRDGISISLDKNPGNEDLS